MTKISWQIKLLKLSFLSTMYAKLIQMKCLISKIMTRKKKWKKF